MAWITIKKNTKKCCWMPPESTLGILRIRQDIVWKTKGQEMVDGTKEKQNEQARLSVIVCISINF